MTYSVDALRDFGILGLQVEFTTTPDDAIRITHIDLCTRPSRLLGNRCLECDFILNLRFVVLILGLLRFVVIILGLLRFVVLILGLLHVVTIPIIGHSDILVEITIAILILFVDGLRLAQL